MTTTDDRAGSGTGIDAGTGGRQISAEEARQVGEAARETEWRAPSFGKELYLGRLRLDLLHPHPRPTPEARAKGEAYVEKLRDYCREHVDAATIDREAYVPDEVITGLAGLGAFGMKIPEEYGGVGLSNYYYIQAIEVVSSASPVVGALLSAHQSIGVPEPLKLFGTDEQKRAYLPRCAAGEISAFLLTEPDVGSDPARLRATAVRDGDHYVLNGVKLWATNGTVASLLVVMALVPDAGITAFVVEADSPGITVERRNEFMGLRGLENSLTRFTDVRVPAANVIGREGRGLKVALSTLNAGRLSLPATCAAAARYALGVARQWSVERVQWGMPVGRHEAVATKIANMAAGAYALEAVAGLCALLADDARNDIRIEAALAKLYCSEYACKIADDLMQIRGGRGYETADSLRARGERGVPIEQLFRDLRINRIFEGSSEIMRLFIAREAVDAHLSVAGDIIDPGADLQAKAKAAARAGGFYARWLPTLAVGRGQAPTGYAEFGPLAGHLRYVERASRKLARSTFYGMARWQGRLERKQAFLGRIVDIGAELFAMTAVCVRARDIDGDNPSATELADVFCQQAAERVEVLVNALWRNTDDLDVRAARRVLDGRYTWIEEGLLGDAGTGPWVGVPEPSPDVRRRVPRGS